MHKSFLFKTITILFLISKIFFLSSCSNEPKPESFGWYAITKSNEFIKLQPQKSETDGWIPTWYIGIPRLSKIVIPDTSIYFIIYDNDVSNLSQGLKLSSLKYRTHTERKNLFVPEESISIEIVPIKNESSMYKIIPTEQLSNGSYALYISNNEQFVRGSLVFDFTITTN
ncbi:MAG TPA: hypothetical protein ENK44_09285 [Caldithrix abyssi]|uniref:Uncharacterized protein n=1 Tax=Caldithrix abyssi TaxID=187145 RepID=A0A7V4U0Y5_CALAY|nr:hypothetical protein [Caldithrix abyssi]